MLLVRETVAHLFSVGEFEDVQVDATSRGDGVDLLFELAPIHPVTRVLFTGIAGVAGADEGRLRSAVLDRFGASPSPGARRTSPAWSKSELARRGYLHARVSPRLELQHAPDRATLVLGVEPGARTTIGAVEVIGAPGIPSASSSTAGNHARVALSAEVLATRIDDYLSDRRDRGFYEARLAALPRFANDDRTVNLSLDAVQGPRVRIVFTGDSCPTTCATNWCRSPVRDRPTRICSRTRANRIRDYLHAQGYRDARVSHQRCRTTASWSSPSRSSVARYRLAAVTLEGNEFFSCWPSSRCCASARASLSTAPVSQADVSTIQDLYRRRGFASAEVDAVVERVAGAAADADVELGIRIVVVEHAQTIVESVRVEGNTAIVGSRPAGGARVGPGAEFFATQLAIDRDAVQAKYANLGFQHATVESDPGLPPTAAPTSCSGSGKGPQIFVEHVLLVGNRRTRAETSNASCRSKPATRSSQDAVIERSAG